MAKGELPQFGVEPLGVAMGSLVVLGPGFEKNPRALLAAWAGADEGRAIDPRVLIEDGLAGNGIERAAWGDHAVRFAAAEPEPRGADILVCRIQRFIFHGRQECLPHLFEIADVAHAVPEGLAVADFV